MSEFGTQKMNREDIIRMAREAGFEIEDWQHYGEAVVSPAPAGCSMNDVLTRFAALVAAAEREACAKVCDAQHDNARTSTGAARADACAAAIRARGLND